VVIKILYVIEIEFVVQKGRLSFQTPPHKKKTH